MNGLKAQILSFMVAHNSQKENIYGSAMEPFEEID